MSKTGTRFAVGIDFGGTFNKLALVNDEGQILVRRRVATGAIAQRDAWMDAMANAITEMCAEMDASTPLPLEGVGIGVPGFVDFERGYIHQLPNVPGWDGVALAALMEDHVRQRVRIDNDVNVMAHGECTFGAGRAYQHAVFLTLGTGVGGGLIINNQLYRGAYSMGGEIGHMTINLHDEPSPHGQGVLEQYAGNQRIVERALRYLDAGEPTSLLDGCDGDRSRVDPLVIEKAAEAGDALCIRVYDEVAEYLAATLASITYLLQPEAFIIGGGVGQSGPILYAPLQRHLEARLNPHFAKRVVIKKAVLGNDAGVLGGAALWLAP